MSGAVRQAPGGGPRPTVGIVGAGILGSVLALRMAQAGYDVTLLERSPSAGGLAATIDFDGHRVDRFYHVIVPSDERMLGLCDELGLAGELRFTPVGVGFFVDGAMHPLNGLADFVRFAPLSPAARARLAWFIARCQLGSDYTALEDSPLEPWLRRHCGPEVVERIWRPLLDSRFDSDHAELPATYMWARTNRMRSARGRGGGAETMGCLRGGHERLIDAVLARARASGARVELGAGVEGLTLADGRVTGCRVDGVQRPFDLTVSTLQPPALARLLPDPLAPLTAAYPSRYLGVVCLVLKVRRTVLPYYSVNICEPTPITTVVETSHVVGTEHTDGLRLLYLPKYCDASSETFALSDEQVFERFTGMLGRLAPDLRREDIVSWTVQRAPLVEPVHAIGHSPRTAPIWPGVPGLALASASQVYPRLLNGESIIELAERVAAEIGERHTAVAAAPGPPVAV